MFRGRDGSCFALGGTAVRDCRRATDALTVASVTPKIDKVVQGIGNGGKNWV
jgi:hypothetical protein